MKAILRVLIGIILVSGVFFSRTTQAFPPYVYQGFMGSVPYGYGYLQIYGPPWPIPYFGYTYLPYYNFMPYYATYGVIAYSASADKGAAAWGYSDLESATANAIQNCGQADCRSLVWVQGGCAAVSTNVAGGNLGWAYAGTLASAKQNARQACRTSGGGTKCVHRAWVCSF